MASNASLESQLAESERYKAVWRQFEAIESGHRASKLLIVASVVITLAARASVEFYPALQGAGSVVGILIAIMFFIGWAWFLGNWVALSQFGCPQCGKAFFRRPWGKANNFVARCVHCGLEKWSDYVIEAAPPYRLPDENSASSE